MEMHIIIAILFCFTVVLAFCEDYLKDSHKIYILAGYAIFMIILATTKSVGDTADALVYEQMFYNNNDTFVQLITEPTYIYISRMVLALGGGIGAVFFIYAIISIPAKLKLYYSLTPYIFTALVIYIPVYFELHEMIQIRVAVAAMFLLASLNPLINRKYWLATGLMICAILFHYSAIVYLPFLLIGNRQLNSTMRIIVGVLLPICFTMYLLKLNWFSLIPSSFSAIDYKIETYQKEAEKGDWADLYPLYLNIYYLAKCALLYLCLYYYEHLVEKHRMAPLLINLFAVSVLFLPSIATIPVIASRVSDLFGIVDGIVFSFTLYLVRPLYIARIAITVVGLYMVIYNMLLTDYFT